MTRDEVRLARGLAHDVLSPGFVHRAPDDARASSYHLARLLLQSLEDLESIKKELLTYRQEFARLSGCRAGRRP